MPPWPLLRSSCKNKSLCHYQVHVQLLSQGQRTIYLFPVYKAFLIYHLSLLPMTCLHSGIKILELQGTYRPCGPAKMRSDF